MDNFAEKLCLQIAWSPACLMQTVRPAKSLKVLVPENIVIILSSLGCLGVEPYADHAACNKMGLGEATETQVFEYGVVLSGRNKHMASMTDFD
jgi:hypothetical protein